MTISKWRIKDFEIKTYRTGTQLKNSAEYAYRIIWNGKEIKRGFSRKMDAMDFIRNLVKIQNKKIDEIA